MRVRCKDDRKHAGIVLPRDYSRISSLFRFSGFSPKPARDITFEADGKEVRLTQFFQSKYGKTVQYPDLPCVIAGNKALYPMEFCEIIPGTALPPRKLTPAQTAAMIDESRQRPSDKKATISGWRSALRYENSPQLKSWHIDVAREPVDVDARVLDPPTVSYFKGGPVKVDAGGWSE